MNLRDYIIKNYRKEMKHDPTETLKNLLTNLFAWDINIEEFKKKFNLEDCTYQMILEFVLDPNNAYEITKFGHESSQKKCYPPGKRTLSARDDYDYGEGPFQKKFR